MSSKLKGVDLTNATVGTKGTIDFNQFTKFQANKISEKAHIRILNESGCGLDTTFLASGNYHFLPAGGWGTFDVEPNDGAISIVVAYTLPNPPVSLVQAIYYAPGEAVPQSFTLGNSPIGIGGTITTSSIQTLSNEGSAANTLVIDIGDVTLSQLIAFYTDHFTLKVDQGGVAHTVLTGSTTGNAAQLGQVSDTVEVLGALQVDGTAGITGNTTVGGFIATTGGSNIQASGQLNSVVGRVALNAKVSLDASGANLSLLTPIGTNIQFQVNGVAINTIDANGFTGNLNYSTSSPVTMGEAGGTSNGFIFGRTGGAGTPVIASYAGGGGIGFKVGGQAGTKVFESKANRDFIIQGGTYWTNQSTFNFSASGAFDAFDLAEFFPMGEVYPDGTVVCPGEDGQMHRCTHVNCERASIVSLHPAFCAGNPDEAEKQGAQPIALCGRKLVTCAQPIAVGMHVYSNGAGGVQPASPFSQNVNALGFALTECRDGQVGIMIRYQQIRRA